MILEHKSKSLLPFIKRHIYVILASLVTFWTNDGKRSQKKPEPFELVRALSVSNVSFYASQLEQVTKLVTSSLLTLWLRW